MTYPGWEMYCTNLPGGPCPVCGKSGLLIKDFGSYAPGATRTIQHSTDDKVVSCTLPLSAGLLSTVGGRWRFLPYPAETEGETEGEK